MKAPEETAQMLNRKHEMFLNARTAILAIEENGLNRKHEMFLNNSFFDFSFFIFFLNRKHEMFLNVNRQLMSSIALLP